MFFLELFQVLSWFERTISSIVIEVIKGNLKPFYLFFYEKISHAQKAKNTYKRTNTKKQIFYAHKNIKEEESRRF